MNGEYNDKAIEACFSGLHIKLDEQKAYLHDIHKQVKDTNGRVSALEKWQYFIKGGLAMLSIIVVPITLYIIYMWISGGF